MPAPDRPPAHIPFVALDMPVLGGASFLELWTADRPVSYAGAAGARLAKTEALLYGAFEAAEDPGTSLEETARRLYERLFRILKDEGYPHLYRVWNYFPAITAIEDGLERYQRFTLGRHEAFRADGRAVTAAPAACALGSGSGPLSVLVLAGREPGRPLENPRQVSAYHYPQRYGPRSPTFSRALLAGVGGRAQLFISGTASIVGHESRHLDDPAAQAAEALTNIRSLIAEARRAGLPETGRLFLKTYVRQPSMMEAIRPVVLAELGPSDEAVFLKAEVCRPELLVEIEGAYIA
jgi:chorismate lyase / 3-hydroxybenzoate synthase